MPGNDVRQSSVKKQNSKDAEDERISNFGGNIGGSVVGG